MSISACDTPGFLFYAAAIANSLLLAFLLRHFDCLFSVFLPSRFQWGGKKRVGAIIHHEFVTGKGPVKFALDGFH